MYVLIIFIVIIDNLDKIKYKLKYKYIILNI